MAHRERKKGRKNGIDKNEGKKKKLTKLEYKRLRMERERESLTDMEKWEE